MSRRRDHPPVIAPPPLVLLIGILIGWGIGRFLPPVLTWNRPTRLVGAGLVTLGFLVGAWCLIEFIRHRTHPDPFHPTSRLIQRGPYRLSRNPIYVAFLLIHVGFGLWRADAWIVASVVCTAAVLQVGVIKPEERYLSEKFGTEYEEYRRRVRRWI